MAYQALCLNLWGGGGGVDGAPIVNSSWHTDCGSALKGSINHTQYLQNGKNERVVWHKVACIGGKRR